MSKTSSSSSQFTCTICGHGFEQKSKLQRQNVKSRSALTSLVYYSVLSALVGVTIADNNVFYDLLR